MKILTLIVATGALLVAGAPTAGAKNTLQCSAAGTATARPTGYRVERNLMSVGTWHPALTSTSCKALRSAKADPARAANASQVARDSL
jgi:hypothetical protein